MLFSNVFNGLTQVAKSVLGLFEKDEHQPISYFEHDKPLVVAPTLEPLNVVPEKKEPDSSRYSENWRDVVTESHKRSGWIVQVSNDKRARVLRQEDFDRNLMFWSYLNIRYDGRYVYATGQLYREKFHINMTFEVLEAFVSARPSFVKNSTSNKVIYIDGNRENVTPGNLRWTSKEECQAALDEKMQENFKVKAEAMNRLIGQHNAVAKNIPDQLRGDAKIEDDLYWMPIPSYEGYYEISNFGTVRSLDRTITNTKGKKQNFKGKHLKRVSTEDGLCYSLSKNGKAETFNVARLTVAVFMAGKIDFGRKFIVKHKDGHNGNCQLSNLEVEYLN